MSNKTPKKPLIKINLAAAEASTSLATTYFFNQHPKHASEIGRLVALWSGIEFHLCYLMSALLEAPNWRAQAAYYAIVNNNTRLDIIRDLTEGMQGADEFGQRVKDIVDRTRTLSIKRNSFVHKPWVLHEEQPYILESLWEYPMGRKRKVLEGEIRDVSKELREHLQCIVDFLNDYGAKHPLIVSEDRIPRKLLERYSGQSRRPSSKSDQ